MNIDEPKVLFPGLPHGFKTVKTKQVQNTVICSDFTLLSHFREYYSEYLII